VEQAAGQTVGKAVVRFDQLPDGITTLLGSQRFRSNGLQQSICYSGDGRIIATGNEDSIDLFDSQTGERIKQLTTRPNEYLSQMLYHVQFIDRDRRLVCSAYPDARLIFWNVSTGKPEVVVRAHERHIMDLDVSPDQRLIATVGDDSTLRIWDAENGQKRREIKLMGDSYHVEFTADGRELYACAYNIGPIQRISVSSGELLGETEVPQQQITLLPDAARYVTTESNGNRIARGLAIEYEELQLTNSDDHQPVAGYSSDGSQVVLVQGLGHSDTPRTPYIEIWDLNQRKLVHSLDYGQVRPSGGGGARYAFAFSPDGKTLAHTAGLQVDRWSLETGDLLPAADGHAGGIADLSFSADGGRLATVGSADGKLIVWNMPQGDLLHTLAATPSESWPQHAAKWQARAVTWISDDVIAAYNINLLIWVLLVVC
jgi:WD40 repeat protein